MIRCRPLRKKAVWPVTRSEIDALLGATPQRRRTRWAVMAVLVVASIMAFVLLERFLNAPASPWAATPLELGDLAPVIHADALLLARDAVTFSAAQDGFARKVDGPEFKAVAKGEALVTFDNRVAAGALAQARAALTATEADLETARFARAETGVRLARFETVWRKSNGRVPSLDEMEAARLSARRATAMVADAEARGAAVRLQMAAAKEQARNAVLRAPSAGVIVARHVVPGQFMHTGAPLITMAPDLDHLLAGASLPGTTASLLPPATQASMQIAGAPARRLRLVRVDPGPGNIWQAMFAIDGAVAGLRPGMQVQLDIPLPLHRGVWLVPNAALDFAPPGTRHAANTLFVLGKDGQVRRLRVVVGGSDGQRTEVAGRDLAEGMQVITGAREPGPKP
jgi:HlyD family secretion protein